MSAQRSDRLISVAVVGTWWNDLTYEAERPASCYEPGVRVRVPLGRGSRVGIVLGPGSTFCGEVRRVESVLDDRSLLQPHVMPLLRWFCGVALCGMGMAIKTLLPSKFIDGEPMDGSPASLDSCAANGGVSFVYDPCDTSRFDRYAEILADGAPSLVVCPTHASAQALFAHLRDTSRLTNDIRDGIELLRLSTPRAEWRDWGRLSSRVGGVAIGAQFAAMVPMPGLARIIVEDESNAVWRTMRPPEHSVRSLLAMRAKLSGASLVLGGRMPSARAFAKLDASGAADAMRGAVARPRAKRTIFVDMRHAFAPAIKDIEGPLAVSEPLVRETERALSSGMWALWALDRKGYAGEIYCADCGASVTCERCGGAMRWEAAAGVVRCVVCRASVRVPDSCPLCGGRMLSGRRPGIEALPQLARSALSSGTPIFLPKDEVDPREPGLIIGTRAVLEELDARDVGLVGWLDADGEARREQFDARARAFGLIWESMWRGRSPESRSVIVQTRRPGVGWQSGLADTAAGWRTFWRAEMDERREFSMPPFMPLIKVEASAADASSLSRELGDAEVEHWVDEQGEGSKRVVWIRARSTREVKNILAPRFDISRARRGYPSITVWYD